MSLRLLPLVCLVAALASASVAVHAAPPSRRQPIAGVALPSRGDDDDALSDSVRRVERSTRGQVLSAERVPFDGRDVNRIKTLDERGRVRVYMDDPRSGQRVDPDAPTRGNDD